MKIDLHLHSNRSDGTLSPSELAYKCKSKNIEFVSLTDHDTIAGQDEFLQIARNLKMKACSGVEISTIYNNKEVHILGYGIDYKNKGFQKQFEVISKLRDTRNRLLLDELEKNRIIIKQQDLKVFNTKSIGRAHIAKAMVKKGYVSTVNEAFDKWIGYNKKAFVPSKRLNPFEAIEFIKRFGGVSVLAHPLKTCMSNSDLEKFVQSLKGFGLAGIEAFYASHNKDESNFLSYLGEKYNLITTCGSDFHDNSKYFLLGEVDNNVNLMALEKKFK